MENPGRQSSCGTCRARKGKCDLKVLQAQTTAGEAELRDELEAMKKRVVELEERCTGIDDKVDSVRQNVEEDHKTTTRVRRSVVQLQGALGEERRRGLDHDRNIGDMTRLLRAMMDKTTPEYVPRIRNADPEDLIVTSSEDEQDEDYDVKEGEKEEMEEDEKVDPYINTKVVDQEEVGYDEYDD